MYPFYIPSHLIIHQPFLLFGALTIKRIMLCSESMHLKNKAGWLLLALTASAFAPFLFLPFSRVGRKKKQKMNGKAVEISTHPFGGYHSYSYPHITCTYIIVHLQKAFHQFRVTMILQKIGWK
jgi:hypothetical protein